MAVTMLDAREAYFRQCAEQNFERASTYVERHFGFQDVEFADDTNLIQTHLPSLRVLTKVLSNRGQVLWILCKQ